MRNLFWLSCLVLVVACAGKSNADQSGAAGSGTSSASNTSAGKGSDPQAARPQTAGTGGARAIDTSRGQTGGSGAGGASATAGSGGQSEHDAGEAGAGQSGHDGGQAGVEDAGSGGSTATACDPIKMDYAAALHVAQICDPRASAPCQQLAVRSLGCYCTTTVSDATPLNDIKARYDDAGCPPDPGCRGIACTSPGTGTCISIDSGDLCN